MVEGLLEYDERMSTTMEDDKGDAADTSKKRGRQLTMGDEFKGKNVRKFLIQRVSHWSASEADGKGDLLAANSGKRTVSCTVSGDDPDECFEEGKGILKAKKKGAWLPPFEGTKVTQVTFHIREKDPPRSKD